MDYQCNTCKKKFSRKDNLVRHFKFVCEKSTKTHSITMPTSSKQKGHNSKHIDGK